MGKRKELLLGKGWTEGARERGKLSEDREKESKKERERATKREKRECSGERYEDEGD